MPTNDEATTSPLVQNDTPPSAPPAKIASSAAATGKPFDPGAAADEDAGIYGLPFERGDAAVIVLPVPFAATTSYGGGAEEGPRAVFEASRQVDLFDLECGRIYEPGIAMVPFDEVREVLDWHHEARALAEPVIARGGRLEGDDDETRRAREGLAQVNALSERVNQFVYESVRDLLAKGKLVALLGGDHSTPFGTIRAHAERYPGLGVLHVDAHADLRLAYEGFAHSHASIMRNVVEQLDGVQRLVQVGIRDFCEEEFDVIARSSGRIQTHFDAHLANAALEGEPWSRTCQRIVADLPEHVYVSFDIDGLDPTQCPHTGTPVPGGLSFAQANYLLATLARSGRLIVGLDLNEVAPGPDGDEWDGNVGARLLYKMIGWMLRSHRRLSAR